jgi:hypothetical protein
MNEHQQASWHLAQARIHFNIVDFCLARGDGRDAYYQAGAARRELDAVIALLEPANPSTCICSGAAEALVKETAR